MPPSPGGPWPSRPSARCGRSPRAPASRRMGPSEAPTPRRSPQSPTWSPGSWGQLLRQIARTTRTATLYLSRSRRAVLAQRSAQAPPSVRVQAWRARRCRSGRKAGRRQASSARPARCRPCGIRWCPSSPTWTSTAPSPLWSLRQWSSAWSSCPGVSPPGRTAVSCRWALRPRARRPWALSRTTPCTTPRRAMGGTRMRTMTSMASRATTESVRVMTTRRKKRRRTTKTWATTAMPGSMMVPRAWTRWTSGTTATTTTTTRRRTMSETRKRRTTTTTWRRTTSGTTLATTWEVTEFLPTISPRSSTMRSTCLTSRA
mmetsp:Transcript_68426/g.222607  ORF Transcript_68426/g.222607 Transcript_68426/m.222607 type:complete len:316 (+) Transcript_68426:2122-3069(+)